MLDNRFAPTNLGLALIVGYSKLNIPLGKPYLRAAMERDCKLICEGAKTRQAVVADCLAEVAWLERRALRHLNVFLYLCTDARQLCFADAKGV